MLCNQIKLWKIKILRLVDDDKEYQTYLELSDLIAISQLNVLVHFCYDIGQSFIQYNREKLVMDKLFSCLNIFLIW